MRNFYILVRYLGRRHRLVLALLAAWTFAASWVFAWMTSQAGLREGITKLLKILPVKLQDSMGGDMAMLMDPTGFLVLGFDHPLLSVPFMFWALLLPLRHLASEQERGLLDVVLVRPVSRTAWLGAILFWQIIGLLIIAFAAAFSMALGCGYYVELQSVHHDVLYGYALMQALWAFAIGGVTAVIAAKVGRFRQALGGAIAFTLITILWEVLCRSIKLWKPYIILSLRHWAEPHTLFPSGWNATGAVVLIATAACAWVVAVIFFKRHDLGAN